jgi:3-hydroxybutyryl-CoA dehydratase
MVTYLEDIERGLVLDSEWGTVTADDIAAFCELSGDFNPLHTDDDHARAAGFRERIAHGLLVLSVSSGLRSLGDDWELNAYLEETRRFRAPVYPGDRIRSVSRVADVRRSTSKPDRGIVTLEVEIVNQDGEVVQSGTDVVMVGARGTA